MAPFDRPYTVRLSIGRPLYV